jgi:hypothetical protein
MKHKQEAKELLIMLLATAIILTIIVKLYQRIP